MKNEFFASVILLAIFICCTAWYRGTPSTSITPKQGNAPQRGEVVAL